MTTRKKTTKTLVVGTGDKNRVQKFNTFRWQVFRLFSILYAKKYVRVKTLVEELEISERVAQRLMAPFKEEGILTRDDYDQGKWNFNEARHSWSKMLISDHDASAMAFICKLSKVLGGQVSKSVSEAVGKAFQIEEEDYPYFMITARVKSPDMELPFFQDLYEAIKNKNKVALTYKSAGADKTVKAWPVSFILCEGMWYLGYLLEPEKGKAQEIRTIRYGHILKIETLLTETFEKPAWVKKTLKEARNIWFNRERNTKVVLEIDNKIKDYFQLNEYFPLQKITSEGKDTFRVETQITNHFEVIPNILRFIPFIKVVSPQSLKEDILEKVKEYLN